MSSDPSVGNLSDNKQNIGTVYVALMQQLILRLDSISVSIDEVRSNPDHFDNWKNAEFCYLQIRKSCEYTALAVLIAHEDYQALGNNGLKKKYHAGEIFTRLNAINPYGFPMAINVNKDFNGVGEHLVEPVQQTLTATSLNTIYGQCGEKLHVGSLDRILKSKAPVYDIDEIVSWHNALIETLGNHMIRLPHLGIALLVTLRNSEDGEVHCAFAEADGQFVIGDDPTVFGVDRAI